jgi:hypothetical protein
VLLRVHLMNQSNGLAIFDYLHAFFQARNNNRRDFEIEFVNANEKFEKKQNTFDIFYAYLPTIHQLNKFNLNLYDVVLFCNSNESLSVASNGIKNLENKKSYFLTNSYLHKDHHLYDWVIPWSNDLLICKQYWLNPKFPQYFENAALVKNTKRNKSLMFINGANRSWRHHCVRELLKLCADIPVKSTLSSVIHETNDAAWESPEDSEFREFVNSKYEIVRNKPTAYYDSSIHVGIDSNHVIDGLPTGSKVIPPGYFILPEYYQYKCIIFPETAWQNDEMNLTEKILKCFYSKTIPWPVGGANINQLFNDHGFMTAWNLLPVEFQSYDLEKNHIKRYKMLAEAVNWVYNNQHVLDSDLAKTIIENNQENFCYSQQLDVVPMKSFLKILNQ